MIPIFKFEPITPLPMMFAIIGFILSIIGASTGVMIFSTLTLIGVTTVTLYTNHKYHKDNADQ